MKSSTPYLIATILSSASAQLLMKAGTTRLGQGLLDRGVIAFLLRLAATPQIVAGLVLYAISAFFWILTLSRADLSYAYPMVAGGYIIVSLMAWGIFHEQMTWTKGAALVIIGAGVALLGISASR